MAKLGLQNDSFFFLKDIVTGESYVWRGNKNYVKLDPAKAPGHMFVVKKI
jgi:starch synthase (maltosyl-transferring)